MKKTKGGRKKVVDPRYAKSKEYRKVIEAIALKGKCPFCSENFKYHKHPILSEEGGWFITRCGWPYKNTKYHFILIGKKHKEHFRQLRQSDFISIRSLVNWASKKFNIKGGVLAHRFGTTEFTGATVCHLHFHLIMPKRGKVVNFPIG